MKYNENMHIFLDGKDVDGMEQELDLEALSPREYPALTTESAKFFLGCILLRAQVADGRLLVSAGIIIETEAYTRDDPASHSYRGRSSRNQAMFAKPGTLYVYRSYGLHHCANIVTSSEGAAVLIRSLLPLAGGEDMLRRRRLLQRQQALGSKERAWLLMRAGGTDQPQLHQRLCRGPGNLCAAMGIDIGQNEQSLYHPTLEGGNGDFVGLYTAPSRKNLRELSGGLLDYAVKQSTRIGISKNREAPWRYFVDIPGYISHSRAGRIIG